MTNKIDYAKVEIPEGLNPEDYHYTHRRAEILKLIVAKGHPRAISQTQLAKRYGVSQGQISHDIKALGESFNAGREENDIKFITEVVYQKCIKKLLDKEDYKGAAQVLSGWNEWLFNTGKVRKEADRIKVDASLTAEDFRKAYEELNESSE